MDVVAALVLGTLTGLHAATWGAFKDSTFEGFRPGSFVRSILVGGTVSVAFGAWQAGHGTESTSVIVWVGVAYTLERLATEWWKSFIRIDDQSAYTIPMRIAVRGRPIDPWSRRWLVGGGVIGVIMAAGIGIALLQDAFPSTPVWIVILAVGGLGGWATAIGGAWKDAPIEGFSGWKFVRSPLVATAWAVPTSLLTVDWFLVMISAGGLSVASIETYKSFFTGGRPPGKFGSKPRLYHLPVVARRLGRLHSLLWAVMGLGTLAALSEVPSGISVAALSSLSPHLPMILLVSIAIGASVVALLVMERVESLRP
jgi:hypothetical protein